MPKTASRRGFRRCCQPSVMECAMLAARTKRFARGSDRCTTIAPARFTSPIAMKASRHAKLWATIPEMYRPRNPPNTVPETYADMARPTCCRGNSSLMYAMMTTITPGTNAPCINRQKMSWCRFCEVAASVVGTVSANSDGTMTFLRPTDSASKPMNGAVKAIARMVELTVSETAISDALKICRR